MKHILLVLTAGFLLASCGGSNDQNTGNLRGSISISGAFAMYPLTVKWVEEFSKINPAVKIDVSAGGAGKGMTDVLNGLVDIAMFSRDVSKDEELKGAWYIAVAKDAVLPVTSDRNPLRDSLLSKGISKEVFSGIFRFANISKWNQVYKGSTGGDILVFTRSDACGAGEMWAKFMGGKQEDLKGTGVYGDPGMCDAVKKENTAIGYNNVTYAYDPKTRQNYEGIMTIPIDINGNGILDPEENFYQNLDSLTSAIRDGRFPAPPARKLYFVCRGRPENPLVLAFLRFVLTDGQQYINEAGYVALKDSELESALEQIKP